MRSECSCRSRGCRRQSERGSVTAIAGSRVPVEGSVNCRSTPGVQADRDIRSNCNSPDVALVALVAGLQVLCTSAVGIVN